MTEQDPRKDGENRPKIIITIRVPEDILPDFQENLTNFIEDFYHEEKENIEVNTE